VVLNREILMTRFSVGEQVIVRYGRQQGQQGAVLKIQPANVYTVKVKDGPILCFSEKGLEQEKERVQEV
jgi:ribosomal protein L24